MNSYGSVQSIAVGEQRRFVRLDQVAFDLARPVAYPIIHERAFDLVPKATRPPLALIQNSPPRALFTLIGESAASAELISDTAPLDLVSEMDRLARHERDLRCHLD
jgi:hypothetical protein